MLPELRCWLHNVIPVPFATEVDLADDGALGWERWMWWQWRDHVFGVRRSPL